MKKAASAWALCAAWMLLIFVMSAAPGETSGEQSGRLLEMLLSALRWLTGIQPKPETLVLLETLLRKAAHMAEYAVLALLSRRAFALSGARRPGLCALLLCVLYAAGDEFHQRFVPDRGPSPVDVMIDTAGTALALALRQMALRIFSAKFAGMHKDA